MNEYTGRFGSGEKGEGAHMPHAPDQPRAQPGAENETGKVGRAEQTQGLITELLGTAPQGQQGIEQSGAQQQQRNAAEQCRDGQQKPDHGAASPKRWIGSRQVGGCK